MGNEKKEVKTTKFEHKKSLGQHFLNNDRVPRLMADAGNVSKDDTILEIGPGTGVLTRELLRRGAKVIAIEADIRAVEMLKHTFSNALTADWVDAVQGASEACDQAVVLPTARGANERSNEEMHN